MKLRSKYRNQPTILDGYHFDSKKEAMRYASLKILESAGQIVDLKVHPRFELKVNGLKICVFEADLSYKDKGSSTLIIEDTKALNTETGKPIITDVARIKHKLFKALYPEIDFRIYA